MKRFYTTKGDDGYTGLLGEGRVPKYDLRTETFGTIDEATAALGLARAFCRAEKTAGLLMAVQRDLYRMMAEVAATPEVVERFRSIGADRVAWLEGVIDELDEQVEVPREFILPGDSQAGASLALARTIVRRAERCLARMLHEGMLDNFELLRFLNRLSSLCFILELVENHAAGLSAPTLAKRPNDGE